MHHREIARAVRVRVRVDIRRAAVRRPAGMADAQRAFRRVPGQLGFQLRQTPDAFFYADFFPVVNGDPGRIIAAVLQPGKPFQEKRGGVPVAHITDNATHKSNNLHSRNFIRLSYSLPADRYPLLCPARRRTALTVFIDPVRPRGIR